MYYTQLPDHTAPGFHEQAHFSQFGKQNIIFNARSNGASCDRHVGCLSFKTVLSGEECYGIEGRDLVVRRDQFLILNNDQPYSCRIDKGAGTHSVSIFFQKEFAANVFHDLLRSEEAQVDNPDDRHDAVPEFYQCLSAIPPELSNGLARLLIELNTRGYDRAPVDEGLVFLLQYLLRTYRSDKMLLRRIEAVRPGTKKEIYKRLCIAKDILHSSYQEPIDLAGLSAGSCLSRPQLIRQFKSVFGRTPYQYLIEIRLRHSAEFLRTTSSPVHEIGWRCGFSDPSAFCRAFRTAYDASPEQYRVLHGLSNRQVS